MQVLSGSIGGGRTRVDYQVTLHGSDLAVSLTGGEGPHIGAVAIAVPKGPPPQGATPVATSVYTRAGHHDDKVARPLAETLARALGVACVAVVGIHMDNATRAEIAEAVTNADLAAREIANRLAPSV